MNNDQHAFSNEIILYGFRPTATGLAAIAVSRNGVVAILLGANRHELSGKLADALAATDLVEDETSIGATLDAVARHVANPTVAPEFDLDMRGSDDERAVWAALRAIPTGETRSYGALAKAIGTGITAQEVGMACAANHLAIVIPCHRVLKADGSISGYRWGVHRKRKLLVMEKAA
ncbi:methylated-DNA--[protein]-cysteine S-methyltransferase [Sphingobium sp. H39-3-25]|uniref:methylated-DNA--[protein]-cysteine S-methyltransferase n=1 Tax=Sphingobium arseniciresistens TaxID=3030834 RepID=UPI0023B89C94|nr:methylated-DNA--[protein]-cysteine S-methyltransferase [Sphingobium arseniciresistens]